MSGRFSERRREPREGRGQRAGSSGWLASDAPWAAVEIASDRVTVAGISKTGDGAVVQGWATEELPAGLVTPSLTSLNVSDPPALADAIRRAAGRAGVKARRAGLVIPDLAAKVSLVPFDTVPDRADDLGELINWQVRKAAPFRIEDAQVAHVPGAPHGDKGRTFVVTLARKDVVRQYEDACAAAGLQAGIVDLASFNVINAVLAGKSRPEGDWLLVNTTRESQTLAIMRGDALVFFRNRPIEGDETLPDLVHQTAMYYEDRLQGAGFERVVLAGDAGVSAGDTRKSLADRLRAPVASIEPRQVAAFSGRGFDDLQPAAADALVAPLGLLLRDKGNNLSTRPFYNERRVHLAAAIVALIVVAFTAWNVTRLVTLSSRRTELRTQSQSDETRAQDLRAQAEAMEKSVDQSSLMRVAASAREANAIINRRAFSWTTFFNRLEETLPPGVMLTSVAPQVENGQVVVNITVLARRTADVDDFMVKLEGSAGFRDVVPINDTITDDGLHRVSLRGRYE